MEGPTAAHLTHSSWILPFSYLWVWEFSWSITEDLPVYGNDLLTYRFICTYFTIICVFVGAGQDGVDFLLGKISDTDVKDVQFALVECLKKMPYLDPEKVVLYGGSHGGFLVTHLSAQYPVNVKRMPEVLPSY